MDGKTPPELRHSLLRGIHLQSPFAACVVSGEDATLEFVNLAFEKLLGRSALAGQQLRQALPPPGQDGDIRELLNRVGATRQPQTVQEAPFSVGDSTRYLRTVAQPLEDVASSANAVHLVAVDITELVESRFRTEELAWQLIEVKRELEDSNRHKDEFLAVLGHELRNPLAALSHAAALLGQDHLPPRLSPAVASIARQTKHMSRLVDDLLDVGRIEQGKLHFIDEPVNLSEVVRGAVDDLRRARKPAQRLQIEYPPIDLWTRGDTARLFQAVGNLLTNAVKYTPDEGYIDITLQREGDAGIFRVRDTGVGLEADFLSKLFIPFEQEPQDLARAQGGLGLGLALASQIIQRHGGTIDARSEGRDRGSTFEIRLPLHDGARQETKKPPSEGKLRHRFVIVEDNRDAAELLEMLLAARGHEVILCFDGARAPSVVWENRPDVVLCDLGLPGKSGFEIATELRSSSAPYEGKLIALSGYGRPDDVQKASAVGFDAHLTKPADVDQILELLVRLEN